MIMFLLAIGMGILGFSMCFSFFLVIFTPAISDDLKSAIAWRVVGKRVSRQLGSSRSAAQYQTQNGEIGGAWLDSLIRAKSQHLWSVLVVVPAPSVITIGLFLEALLHPRTLYGYKLFYAAGMILIFTTLIRILLGMIVESRHPLDSLVLRVTWALSYHDRIMQKNLKRTPYREANVLRRQLSSVENSVVKYWLANSSRGRRDAEFGSLKVAWLLESLNKAKNNLHGDFVGQHSETVQALYGCIDFGCGLRWKWLPDGDPRVLRSRVADHKSWLRRTVGVVSFVVLAALTAVLWQIRSDGTTVALSTFLGAAVTALRLR